MVRAHGALPRLRAVVGTSSHRAGNDTFVLSGQIPGLPALARGAVHEFFAATKQDAPTAAGFAACVAHMSASGKAEILWVRHADKRAGNLYGHGLATLGLDPDTIIHLSLDDEKDVLRAALEGVRNTGMGCVIIEIAGRARFLDLTATRRLNLAATENGIVALIVRSGTEPGPSAAQTRWRVASLVSRSPGLGLPGKPAFALTLLKHRSAEAGGTWDLEWDHETRQFAPKTLSRGLAALSFDRPHTAPRTGSRTHTG